MALMFVIRDWWISIRFVYFMFQRSLPLWSFCFGLVKFALQIFMIFLILVTCKNKATSASFLRQKIHPPSWFPSLFLSRLKSFLAKQDVHVTMWFALTPPLLKWLTEQKNPKYLRSLQNSQRDTTNFTVNWNFNEFHCKLVLSVISKEP